MFAPMSPMTERTLINNERQLNAARMTSYSESKHNRLAVLKQKLTLRRHAA